MTNNDQNDEERDILKELTELHTRCNLLEQYCLRLSRLYKHEHVNGKVVGELSE